MGFRAIYQSIDSKAHLISRQMGAKQSARHYYTLRTSQGLPMLRLTAEQKRQVNDVWNGCIKSNGFATHELLMSVTGQFDPYICSEMLFRTKIELELNNFQLKFGFSEKNYFDMLFPNMPFPKTVFRNINGVFLDEYYHPISQNTALSMMNEHQKLIAKPSIDTGFGKSVTLYQNQSFKEVFNDFEKNYIVQEVLSQHSTLANLNESSVNVVRVVSLSLNGNVSPVNCALRCGATGSVSDNFISKDGRGMFVIGINPDGTLKDKAYYSCGEQISVAPNGQSFAGLQLPNYKEALELTTSIHETLPHFGFIAFDVCFDLNGAPRIMELNIRGPGMLYYQYANGPLFGERTQEVIDTFCK